MPNIALQMILIMALVSPGRRGCNLTFHSSLLLASPSTMPDLSYRVRGVDGSCAEHLTVESYTATICQQSYLLLLGIPSPTHFFILCLKPTFSANPFHRCPPFFLLQDSLHGFPSLFTVISEHTCFLLFSFSVFTLLVVGSVR